MPSATSLRPTEREHVLDAMRVERERMLDAMRAPGFYPHRPPEVETRETPTSWVFLAGDRAYKLKKPVTFPFLDYSVPELRRRYCEEEVRVNRPLAPDLYLGVRAVVQKDGRYALADAGAPGAVDHVVEMARFDERNTLAAAVAEGRARRVDAARAGEALARFHDAAEPRHRRDPEGEPARIKRVLNGNFEAIARWGHVLGAERVAAAERFASAFLAARGPGLIARARRGRVRDGHGDVRAEHVLLGEAGVTFVDRLEFDPELREIDVGADLGFLVMDLVRLGAGELAWDVVESYREAGGDPGPDAHIAFHAAVRAWVRTKIACLKASAAAGLKGEPEAALEEARTTFAVGEQLSWRARLPLVVVVCGVPASGKSALAAALADRSSLPVEGSDVTRKRMLGLKPVRRAPDEAYEDAVSHATYRELGEAAVRHVAESGGSIIDATFRRRSDRRAFREGLGRSRLPTLYVECVAPEDVLTARARRRAGDPAAVSDAGPDQVERLRRQWEPLGDVAPGRHVLVRTDRALADVVDDVVAMLDRRLEGAAPTPAP